MQALLWLGFEEAQNVGKRVHLSEETQRDLVREAIIYRLQNGYLHDAKRLAQEWRITPKEVRPQVESVFLHMLEQGLYREALDIHGQFDCSQTFLHSDRVLQCARNGMLSALERGWLSTASLIAAEYYLPGPLQSAMGKEAFKQGMKQVFLNAPSKESVPEDEFGEESASIEEAAEFLKTCRLPMEMMREGARDALREALEARRADTLRILALLPKDIIRSEDFLATRESFEQLTDVVVSAIQHDGPELINTVKGYFPQDFLQQPKL